MKKARKLGLQSLALVLMAFVLVAGVAFGMTGAWFQDHHADSDTITMGQGVWANLTDFSLTKLSGDGEDGKVMPGDVWGYAGAIKVTMLLTDDCIPFYYGTTKVITFYYLP